MPDMQRTEVNGALRAPLRRPSRHNVPLPKYLNKVVVGDCVGVMREFPADCVDLTVTSPPYDDLRDYCGYRFDFEGVASELYRITRDGGVVVWVVGDRIKGGRTLTSFYQAIGFKEAGFAVHDVMIYKKKNTPFMRKNAYTNCYEFMFVMVKGKTPKTFAALTEPTARNGYEMLVHNKRADGINRKRRGKLNAKKTRANVWEYAVGLGGTTNDRYAFEHPAMFPEKLAADHILSWSKKGDVVLDPMCGSGTTLKMAAAHGRSYIGIDVSKEYAAIARRRIKEASSVKAS